MLVSRTGLSALCDSMSKKKGDRLRFVLSQINRALGVKAEPAEEINGDRLLIDGIPARRVNGNRVVVKDVINAMRIKVGRFNMSEYLEGLDASLEPIRVQMGRSAKCYGNVFAYTIPESNIEALTERLKTISLSWGRPVELVEPEVIEATIVEPSDEVFTQAEDPEVSALVPFSDFSFEGNPVRTHVMEDGTVMFHGGDVCRILGYVNGSRDIKRHCKRSKTLRSTETVGLELNPRGELFIPESDVYRLVMRSNMPHAERFQTWVCEEVIPSLRKTGRYQIGAPAAQVPSIEEFQDSLMKLLSVSVTAISNHIATVLSLTTTNITNQIGEIKSDLMSVSNRIGGIVLKKVEPAKKNSQASAIRKLIVARVVSGCMGYPTSIAERWLKFYEHLSLVTGISITAEARKSGKKPMPYLEEKGMLDLALSEAQKYFSYKYTGGYKPLV